ncbi:hypothetical protein J0H58_26160 [bacterium]|nr:hypothetical protein [bacterium]
MNGTDVGISLKLDDVLFRCIAGANRTQVELVAPSVRVEQVPHPFQFRVLYNDERLTGPDGADRQGRLLSSPSHRFLLNGADSSWVDL